MSKIVRDISEEPIADTMIFSRNREEFLVNERSNNYSSHDAGLILNSIEMKVRRLIFFKQFIAHCSLPVELRS